MHLQLPPHDHTKAVHCLAGAALDVVVDLRSESPTLGRHATIDLRGDRPELVVVPPGCAHGFQALTDDTVMVYLVSSVHEPAADSGIRWDSFDCEWPLTAPTVSDRDRALPTFETFATATHGPWRR
jgi:dTDP-4-dehydrorhamnose 3,5-epimerase